MRLLIACDMEGITGVTRWEHCEPDHAEYQRFRKRMTKDVNAVIRGLTRFLWRTGITADKIC